jgi:hypothetical protein
MHTVKIANWLDVVTSASHWPGACPRRSENESYELAVVTLPNTLRKLKNDRCVGPRLSKIAHMCRIRIVLPVPRSLLVGSR